MSYLFSNDGLTSPYFRPLLADIVQPDDIKELCKLLVVVSGEAAKAYTGIVPFIVLIVPFACLSAQCFQDLS
jgi:hypothetical protein